jgi:hypothetical protein
MIIRFLEGTVDRDFGDRTLPRINLPQAVDDPANQASTQGRLNRVGKTILNPVVVIFQSPDDFSRVICSSNIPRDQGADRSFRDFGDGSVKLDNLAHCGA